MIGEILAEVGKKAVEAFKEIKPQKDITVKKADSFWKQEFTKEAQVSEGEKTPGNNRTSERIEPRNDVANRQTECIKKAEKTRDLNSLDSQAKGNYAEMKVDRDLAGKGYERISKDCVTDLETPTGPGIDGVFVDKKTGKTSIVETKFNKSELGDTLDGKQMCDSWIDKRLDSAVGPEMADKIRMDSILNPDSVQSILAKVDLNGNVSYYKLDSAANVMGGIKL